MTEKRIVYITDVCSSIFAGGDAPKKHFSFEQTEECCYPVFSNGESHNGLYGYTNTARVTEPSITVSARGTIGFTAIRLTPFTPIVRLISITPIQDIIDIDYLYYALSNYTPENTGTSIPQLTVPMIKKYKFRLPEKDEQKRAVKTLKQLDDILEKGKIQIQKLDELVKSRFVEMFGDPVYNQMQWDTVPLEKLCLSIVDCPHSTPKYTNIDTGYMCIRTSIVKKNNILWDKIEFISEEEYYHRIKRKKPQKGDIVYTREGAILGIAAIINRECNVALGQRSMLLSVNTKICCPEFLCFAMNFDSFFNSVTHGISGSASPHINVADIKAFNIIMPTISLQSGFADFVSKVEQQKAAVQKSIDKLETLKKSLMQDYFG